MEPDLQELKRARGHLWMEREIAQMDEDLTMLERTRRLKVYNTQLEKLNAKIEALEKL